MLPGIWKDVRRALRKFLRLDNGHMATVTHSTHEMERLTAILRQREASGQTTQLRQLHSLADIPQPRALTTARLLEQAGLVTIVPDLADAFASQIRLSVVADKEADGTNIAANL